MTGPAAEVRRTGWWRWTVTLTGVRTHARPRTVRGPAWRARRVAAGVLARATAASRAADFTIRLTAAAPQLEPAAGILARHAAAGFTGPYPPPVNLYRSPGWTEPVRVIGPDGQVAWEGTAEHAIGDAAAEVVAVWPAGPPAPGHYHVAFGDPDRGGFLP